MSGMTTAWVASAPGEPLITGTIALPELRTGDIEIDVLACGLCHSDLHLIEDHWEISRFPLVPGHEIVGRVSGMGQAVDGLEIGQRVGVGWYCDACLSCEHCESGEDQLCAEALATCVERPGGFAAQVRVDARFAHPIPDVLSDHHAAPLLCAGVTVFSPLRRLLDEPAEVGVVGIGGLGHLALQYGKQMGHRMTGFARSPTKRDDAIELGASDFVSTLDQNAMLAMAGTLDLLLTTVSGDLDWGLYLDLLRPNGTLCLLGIPGKSITIPAGSLVGQQKFVTGSSVGSRAMIGECLAFSASEQCLPWVSKWPLDQVNDALSALSTGDLRYRAVLTF